MNNTVPTYTSRMISKNNMLITDAVTGQTIISKTLSDSNPLVGFYISGSTATFTFKDGAVEVWDLIKKVTISMIGARPRQF